MYTHLLFIILEMASSSSVNSTEMALLEKKQAALNLMITDLEDKIKAIQSKPILRFKDEIRVDSFMGDLAASKAALLKTSREILALNSSGEYYISYPVTNFVIYDLSFVHVPGGLANCLQAYP
jgi:hypothetical protein